MAFVRKNRKETGAPVATAPPNLKPDVASISDLSASLPNGNSSNGGSGAPAVVMAPRLDNGPLTTRLGEQLIGSRLITQEELDAALADQEKSGGRLGEVLVRQGVLTEQALAHALAAFLDRKSTRLNSS